VGTLPKNPTLPAVRNYFRIVGDTPEGLREQLRFRFGSEAM
jgi:hypothetical protein